ncbi:MAG: hypothetical protein A2511_14785 [Deltaproteobacteria bacterium RIFOXYD12_FULL_50_9]|nr:MAG: hypothetical protein A2511_14785 [Deltaproteobacteria bacterium RIFOXYD12_FULL_50_9]
MYQGNTVQLDDPGTRGSVDTLLFELDHYRRKSARLLMMNELLGRLAVLVDMASMIEAYSVWLMPSVSHDLIAYSNPVRKRTYMFCSSHGPDRRLAMNAAESVIERLNGRNYQLDICEGEYFVQSWPLTAQDDKSQLLLVRRGKEFSGQEVEVIQESLGLLGESLRRALGYEDLFEQARHDILTGLANRRVFEERIGPLMDNARRHGYSLTLASMDLDHFKEVNDTLGHATGDDVLQQVAKVLAGMIRSSDLLVRMGGDEFILVLPDTGLESARILAERLCAAVDGLNIRVSGTGKLGISIGLSQWQPELSRDEWMQRADEALYQAKATGRSRVSIG